MWSQTLAMEKKRKFTWEELSSLNKERNAHVAVRGKVRFRLQFYAPFLISGKLFINCDRACYRDLCEFEFIYFSLGVRC